MATLSFKLTRKTWNLGMRHPCILMRTISLYQEASTSLFSHGDKAFSALISIKNGIETISLRGPDKHRFLYWIGVKDFPKHGPGFDCPRTAI